jgi:hypothetical protein
MAIIESYFDGLTTSGNPVEKRTKLFCGVRDITYKLVPSIRNSVDGPGAILEMGCGSCTPKHLLLGQLFERLDIPTGYVSYPFYWGEQNIAYSPKLRDAARELPYETHLAIKARIGGNWVLVDATWDLGLADSGLPINKTWDGMGNTLLAVNAIDEIAHASANKRDLYVEEVKSKWTTDEHRRMFAFYKLFNDWLDEYRSENRPT